MYKLDIFKDWSGDYRWRLVSDGGHVLVTSGDRFSTRELARSAATEASATVARMGSLEPARAA